MLRIEGQKNGRINGWKNKKTEGWKDRKKMCGALSCLGSGQHHRLSFCRSFQTRPLCSLLCPQPCTEMAPSGSSTESSGPPSRNVCLDHFQGVEPLGRCHKGGARRMQPAAQPPKTRNQSQGWFTMQPVVKEEKEVPSQEVNRMDPITLELSVPPTSFHPVIG